MGSWQFMFSSFWRRYRRHLSIVILLPFMAPVFTVLGASLIIAFTINSPFPAGSEPSGKWISIFSQQDTDSFQELNLELLSKRKIGTLNRTSQAAYIQASHFRRQVTHEDRALDSQVAFVNPQFFSVLGVNSPLHEIKPFQALVNKEFANKHRIVENDTLLVGNVGFVVAGLLDGFAGLNRKTDIYFPIKHLDEAIYHEIPEHLRDLITADLPLYFYAQQIKNETADYLISASPSFSHIEGIIYAPHEFARLQELNNYIFSAAIFLGLLFVLTDYALSKFWVQHRQGELALMATVGATRRSLILWFLKKWLIMRVVVLSLVCALLPTVATYLLQLMGFERIRVDTAVFFKSAVLLAVLYSLVLALSARTLIRNLTSLSSSLRTIRATTRRLTSHHLPWAGGALMLLVVITAALISAILQFQDALEKPDHINSESLYAVTFTLAPGYQVDNATLRRRTQTVATALQHFSNKSVSAAATNMIPMREPIYRGNLSSIGGRSLRQPVPISIANVGINYQTLVHHKMIKGEWPRSANEVAVNESLLSQFGIRFDTLPELWIEGIRYQVTAVIKDSYWLDPLSSPTPVIWRITASPSSSLLVKWDGAYSELEEELFNIVSNLNSGIIIDKLKSINALRAERMQRPYLLLHVLSVVSLTTTVIAALSLWVAMSHWLIAKKWAFTVHLALGATTSHLRRELLSQVIWPLVAFLPFSAAFALSIAKVIDHEVEVSVAFQTTLVALVFVTLIVFAIVTKAYQHLLRLDPASLSKDVT